MATNVSSAVHVNAASNALGQGGNLEVFSLPPQSVIDSKPAGAPELIYSARREHTYRLSAILLIGDWLTACIAIFFGLHLRDFYRHGRSFITPLDDKELMLIVSSIGGSSLFVLIMAMMGTYELKNIYRMEKWLRSAIHSVLISATAAWALIGLFTITDFAPRVGIVYCMGTILLLLALWRMGSFMFLMKPGTRESVNTRTIVVGWNSKVATLRKAMRRDIGQLEEIVGCVPIPRGRFATKPPAELAVLGDYSGLARYVEECQVHSIILADLSCPAVEIRRLIAFCQREMIGFRMVPEYFPALATGLQIEIVSGIPLLSVSQLPLDRALNRALKRGVDLIGGAVGLILAAVFVPIFGAIVYAQSPGPIIYPQLRTSRSGRPFYIYKIRSMKIDAEGTSGAVWAKRDDPRRLKIGVFMRKFNIDEIPQFWNVVKGDMSLVGPRPERPELIAKFKESILNYNARHEVRTGITGWAQVNGLRGDCDLPKRIAADLYYLENWSLWLDLRCIFRTFFTNKNSG